MNLIENIKKIKQYLIREEMIEKLAEYLKEWNEEDHPRVPAGSSEGGQFTESEIKDVKYIPFKDFNENADKIIEENKGYKIVLYHGSYAGIDELKEGSLYFSPFTQEANEYILMQAGNNSFIGGKIYKTEVILSDLERVDMIDTDKRYNSVIFSDNNSERIGIGEDLYFRIDNPKKYKLIEMDYDEISKEFFKRDVKLIKRQ